MITENNQGDINKKIVDGLKIAFKKLLEVKKQNGQELAIIKDGKIILVKPEYFNIEEKRL